MNQISDMRAVDRIEHAMSLVERDVNTPRLLQPKGSVSVKKFRSIEIIIYYLSDNDRILTYYFKLQK